MNVTPLADDAKLVVAMLRRFGYALTPPILPRKRREIEDYFASKPIYHDAHVPQTARNRGEVPQARYLHPQTECYCVPTDEVLLAPHLLEYALSLTDVAGGYLDVETPVMYSTNAFWTRPGPLASRPDIQEFHSDRDDVRFLALFVLLTDTYQNEGAQELEGPDGVVRSIFGPAGTCFLADTSRNHRGKKPVLRERGVVWFRWGVSEYPPANRWDRIEPIRAERLGSRYPHDARLQRSIRLLVQ